MGSSLGGTGRQTISRRLTSPARALAFAALITPLWPATGVLAAPSFEPGRGINLDIWQNWPNESAWSDPETILPFPQWRQFLGSADLEALAQTGFDMVRMPVDPSVFLSEETTGLREELYGSVAASTEAVLDAGMRVVVDLHAFSAGANRAIGIDEILSEPALLEDYLALVRRMAARLAGFDPQRVSLELMNEPHLDCEGAEAVRWQGVLQRLYRAARAQAPALTLILSGACLGTAEGIAAIDPRFADRNVIWSFHSYAPFILTSQGAGWMGDVAPHLRAIPYPPFGANAAATETAIQASFEAVDADAPTLRRGAIKSFIAEELEAIDSEEKLQAVLRAPFETVADWADRYGIDHGAILLGEFGMIRQEWQAQTIVDPQSRAAYYGDVIAIAESYGYGWALWGYGGAFGVVESFDRERTDGSVLSVISSLPARSHPEKQ